MKSVDLSGSNSNPPPPKNGPIQSGQAPKGRRSGHPLNERQKTWLAGVLIAFAALLAYHNSFSGPFIFDDKSAIETNDTIRNLWPIWPVITPLEGGGTVCGRPVLNLSFALNYAAGGLTVWGYHAVNLSLHILAGLTLFGFVRRTLLQPALVSRYGSEAWTIALVIAALWTLHPLQTESVTYIVQRAESLAGLFYLLTLYGFVRGIERDNHPVWLVVSVLSCAMGVGSKEIVASAPIIVLLYDRTFVAGTFRKAWRRRRTYYLALASTWILLAYLIASTGNRGGTAGITLGLTPFQYLLTQCCAIPEYLRLTFWPHPLILDYGKPIITEPARFLLPGLVIVALGIFSLIEMGRRTVFGFLGCWFFALLAPTSSFVAVASQTMAGHRMYLPLAAVLMALVLGLYAKMGRGALVLCAGIAVIFGGLTVARNRDYQSERAIWSDTVLKCPGNARALGNLGGVLMAEGEFEEAAVLFEESIKLDPNDAKVRSNFGIALYAMAEKERGIAEFRHALVLDPDSENARLNLAVALTEKGEIEAAREHLEVVLRLDPNNALARKAMEIIRQKKSRPAP